MKESDARKLCCLRQKPHTERISMSLQKAYQMTIIADLFQAKLNPSHELLILAERIDWELLAERLSPKYSSIGRKGKPIRLMIGAHILKHMHDLSDDGIGAG